MSKRVCYCGNELPPPPGNGIRIHCSRRCRERAADLARRQRERSGTARAPGWSPFRHHRGRVCRFCGVTDAQRKFNTRAECGGCERRANRNGRCETCREALYRTRAHACASEPVATLGTGKA